MNLDEEFWYTWLKTHIITHEVYRAVPVGCNIYWFCDQLLLQLDRAIPVGLRGPACNVLMDGLADRSLCRVVYRIAAHYYREDRDAQRKRRGK